MEKLLEILTAPDNIPILGMLIAIITCLCLSFKQALKNDRLLQEGGLERVYEEMTK